MGKIEWFFVGLALGGFIGISLMAAEMRLLLKRAMADSYHQGLAHGRERSACWARNWKEIARFYRKYPRN